MKSEIDFNLFVCISICMEIAVLNGNYASVKMKLRLFYDSVSKTLSTQFINRIVQFKCLNAILPNYQYSFQIITILFHHFNGCGDDDDRISIVDDVLNQNKAFIFFEPSKRYRMNQEQQNRRRMNGVEQNCVTAKTHWFFEVI